MDAHVACGQAYGAALSRHHQAELHADLGDARAAETLRRSAHEVFDRLGQWPGAGE